MQHGAGEGSRQAKQIADTIVHEQRKTGVLQPMPVLDRHWFLRFKRDKGIVFRRPNLRFKCSQSVLLARLRAMWCNLVRVRRLAELLLGTSLGDSIYGVDEKPIHFNESGPKVCRTLELAGAPGSAAEGKPH